MRENCVLIIAGPSGVGKTVVAESLVALDPRFTFLRSGTTRPKRGDAHDDEYLYFTEEEFLLALERGEFAEHMRYGGHLYGTPKSELKRAFDAGKIPLMVLDLVGVESMAHLSEYSACSVYLYTDPDLINSRLAGRYNISIEGGDVAAYDKRRSQNERDFSVIESYVPYFFRFIDNGDTIEACRDRVYSAFKSFVAGECADSRENTSFASMLKGSVK